MKTRVDTELNELEGFMELGMAKESLTLARRLLDSSPINAARFTTCLDALLILGDRLRGWRGRVDAAFERLTKADKRAVGEKAFHFFMTAEDWGAAHALLPRRPTSPASLLLAMWTLLELRKTDEARRLLRQCRRWQGTLNEEFEVSCCTEAAGLFYAQIGEWSEAEKFWTIGEGLMPFGPNATEGIVKIHALMAHQKADAMFASLRSGKLANGDFNLMLPPRRGSTKDAEMELRRCARHLAQVVPEKERWRFGLNE